MKSWLFQEGQVGGPVGSAELLLMDEEEGALAALTGEVTTYWRPVTLIETKEAFGGQASM